MTLSRCLDELRPFLREPLVTEESLVRLSRRTAVLPDAFTAFYLECGLSPPRQGIDLLAGVLGAPPRSSSELLHEPEDETPIGAFIRASLSAPEHPGIWVEFDDTADPTPGRLENIHVCVDRGYAATTPSPSRLKRPPTYERADALELLERLSESGVVVRQQRETLEDCLAALPDGGRLVHVSSMAARTPLETKAYVALPVGTLERYLSAVGGTAWRTAIAALEPWSEPELNGSTIYCDVTFRGSHNKSFGLVFSQPQLAEVGGDASRHGVRKRLLQEGLSTLAQDRALAAWVEPPRSRERVEDPTQRLLRWLDLKVTAEGRRLSAKAYLGFAP